MTQNYIGVDLSKDWLDIFNPREGHDRIRNTDTDIRRWLAGLSDQDLIVFEATSLCDGRILRLASAHGRPFHRLNPLHGWHFARSLNLPKTDRVDARMLSRMGAERRLAPSACYDAARAGLAELNMRRDQIKRMETQEKNRLAKAASASVRADIRSLLSVLAGRIKRIEAQIAAFLQAHPDLAGQVRRLESLPGVGRVVSVTLLCHMPELGRCDRRQIASLGGLAPRARESGQWRGRRFIGEGRRHVRRALYLAALSAMRVGGICPDMVNRMRAAGKPGKVIAIAVARKLLTIANALIRDRNMYQAKA